MTNSAWLDCVIADRDLGGDCHAVARQLATRHTTINPSYCSFRLDHLIAGLGGMHASTVSRCLNKLAGCGYLRELDYGRATRIYCLEVPPKSDSAITDVLRSKPVSERQRHLHVIGAVR
jgi:hypothetical protein